MNTFPPERTQMTAGEVLRHMSAASERGIYVIGSYEGRVTIQSQQIRALNLIFALADSGLLRGDTRVAVIGGGVAGMTAARAATIRGAAVTLYETQSELLHLFRGCHTRYVHPNIYDWPNPGAADARTHLPFLNWTAGTAEDVARQLLDEWHGELQNPRLEVALETTVVVRGFEGDRRRVTIITPSYREEFYDLVVLAVGFGLERGFPPQPLRSYWRDDSLHQPELANGGRATRYLVSGNGDGGLVDVLRLRLRDFRHELLVAELEAGLDLETLKSSLLGFEHEAKAEWQSGRDVGRFLHERYRSIPVPAGLDERLLKRLRKDTHVFFNYVDWPLSLRASILHRFLVSRLLVHDKNLRVLSGRIRGIDGLEPQHKVVLETEHGQTTLDFDRVVVRHGPMSRLAHDFPAMHSRLEQELAPKGTLDATRRPVWPEQYFARATQAVVEKGESSDAINSTPENGSISDSSKTADASVAEPELPAASAEGVSRGVLSGGPQAFALTKSLLTGPVAALEEKLSLLKASDRSFVLSTIALRVMRDERAFQAFLMLVRFPELLSPGLGETLTGVVQHAAFSESIDRRARLLELQARDWKLVDPPVAETFFRDVLELVARDNYEQVNVLVPKLAAAQDSIPDTLYGDFFRTLIKQLNSGAGQVAPTALRALTSLPMPIVEDGLRTVDANYLLRSMSEFRPLLRDWLPRLSDDFPRDTRTLIDDFCRMTRSIFLFTHRRAPPQGKE